MGQKLPRVSSKQMIAALLDIGFVITKTRGSHTYLEKGDVMMQIPKRRSLTVKSIHYVRKTLGLTIGEFTELLRRS